MQQCRCQLSEDRSWIDLSRYNNEPYNPGRSKLVLCAWYFTSLAVFESGWFPFSRAKVWLLRMFGAHIGRGSIIKPHVRIKYPWRFETGDYCWIGQEVWIDNLANVSLGSHVCLSQRTYICTGGHDFNQRTFDLTTAPVDIDNGSWVGAASLILGGVSIGSNSLVAAGSVVTADVPRATIVAGVPGRKIGIRTPPDHAAFPDPQIDKPDPCLRM